MTLGEWMAKHQKTTGDVASALRVEKDSVRAWMHGRKPIRLHREKIFVLTNGQVSWDKYFEDHPDTIEGRTGGRSVKGR